MSRNSETSFHCTESYKEDEKTFLSIEILESLVISKEKEDDAQLNEVEQIFNQIREDDKKWDNFPLSSDDIKGKNFLLFFLEVNRP